MGQLVPDDTWVKLAVLTTPHGVKGALKVKSFTTPPRAFADYALTDKKGNTITLTIIGGAEDAPIVTIQGISSREEAELLRNTELGAPRSALKPLADPRAHYASELIGMQVVDKKGALLGSVSRVLDFGAGDILDIIFETGEQEMFSFTTATFPEVDATARRITMVPPTILGSRKEEEGDVA